MSIDWKKVQHDLKIKAKEYGDRAMKTAAKGDVDFGVALDATMDSAVAVALKEFASILENRLGH